MKKKRMLAVALSAVLVGSLIPFSACKKGDKISAELRGEMSVRTATAQFMPDARTVAGEIEQAVHTVNVASAELAEEETAFDVFDIEAKLQDLAVIEGNGAGKYLGYEVDEIKIEMYNMVNRAPWMNEWFRVPRAEGGTDYFSNWAYLIENNLEYNFLSITRVSWRTTASYFDPEDREEKEADVQYNVMRTKYYMEEGLEIVEVEMFDVMQLHGEYRLMAYLGLKNAEDAYFFKYNIEAQPRTRSGYAIDTNTPYGANREFAYMTYGNGDYNLLQLTQRYPNEYRGDRENFGQYEAGASLVSVSKTGNEHSRYALSYEYGEDETTPVNPKAEGENAQKLIDGTAELAKNLGVASADRDAYLQTIKNGESVEGATETLLNTLSKRLVDGHELANSWSKIEKDSENALKEILPEVDLPLKAKYTRAYVDMEGYFGETKEILFMEAQAFLVPNPEFRNLLTCEYYLAPALMNKRGELFMLENEKEGSTNDFDLDHDPMWYGTWLEVERKKIYPNDVAVVTENGEYALVLALRKAGETAKEANVRLVQVRTDREKYTFAVGEKTYEIYSLGGQLRVKVRDFDSEEDWKKATY